MLLFARLFQRNTDLSSGEAKLAAQVGGLADSLGVQNLAREWGCALGLRSHRARNGVGKLRLLEVKQLSVQDLVSGFLDA